MGIFWICSGTIYLTRLSVVRWLVQNIRFIALMEDWWVLVPIAGSEDNTTDPTSRDFQIFWKFLSLTGIPRYETASLICSNRGIIVCSWNSAPTTPKLFLVNHIIDFPLALIPKCAWLFRLGPPMVYWLSPFGYSFLRGLSFGIDYMRSDNSNSRGCTATKYIAYMFFPPLLLNGPIIAFDDFSNQFAHGAEAPKPQVKWTMQLFCDSDRHRCSSQRSCLIYFFSSHSRCSGTALESQWMPSCLKDFCT